MMAIGLVNEYGYCVSESMVYRILRREGLVKKVEVKRIICTTFYAMSPFRV